MTVFTILGWEYKMQKIRIFFIKNDPFLENRRFLPELLTKLEKTVDVSTWKNQRRTYWKSAKWNLDCSCFTHQYVIAIGFPYQLRLMWELLVHPFYFLCQHLIFKILFRQQISYVDVIYVLSADEFRLRSNVYRNES